MRLPHNLANPVPISLLWTLKLASSICMNCVQMYYPQCSENKTSSVLFFYEATFMQGMYHPQQSSRRFQSFPRASQLIWPAATHCGDEGGLRKTPAKREKRGHTQQNSKPGNKVLTYRQDGCHVLEVAVVCKVLVTPPVGLYQSLEPVTLHAGRCYTMLHNVIMLQNVTQSNIW